MDARVLIKYSTSKCNETLLTWLHSNINTIKKSINLKVIVVYEKHYSKLGNKITKLPALILNGTLVTGNSEIKKYITNAINAGGEKTGKSNIDEFRLTRCGACSRPMAPARKAHRVTLR